MEITRFGYYWLDTWVLANVIQLATQDFCTRFLNRTNDPCGRLYDQMTQAARSDLLMMTVLVYHSVSVNEKAS